MTSSFDAARLAAMRAEYSSVGLDESEVADTWWEQFGRWFDQAVDGGVVEPNAMVVATANADGVPAARTVLAKGIDERGVVFYTNYESAKSQDLNDNPHAAVTFPWYQLQRQIHLRGPVVKVEPAETAAYWVQRPRNSRLGAWASPQSRVVADRAELDAQQAAMAERFPDDIPVPPHWGGWRLSPVTVEFWQGRTARMHDRIRYRLVGDSWVVERLAP